MKLLFNVRFAGILYPLATFCLLLLTSFAGCDRDRGPGPAPGPACRITRRYDPAGAVPGEIYRYDPQRRLVEAYQEKDGNAFNVRTFAYDDDNRLRNATFAAAPGAPVTQTTTYRYDPQGRLTGWVTMENGRHTEITRELDAAGTCTGLTSVATDLNSGVSSTARFAYEYQDGNLVRHTSDPGTESERHYTYAYYPDRENKLGAYEAVTGTLPGPSPNRHMRKTRTRVATADAAAETWHYTYAYNAEGFPTRITSVVTSANATDTLTTVLKYDCQ